MCDISNTPASSTLLSIFIQQIQPSPLSPPSILVVIIAIVIRWRRGRIGEGEAGTRGRRRGCLAAILGRRLRVVTVEVVVVVVVPAPARRRAMRGRVGSVVTGSVLVDVTGHGRLVVVVVTGRVRVDVVGRV